MSWYDGMASSLAGGLIGGVLGLIDSSLENEYARDLTQLQYNLSQRSLIDSPSNYRTGLENAGYNPILAISSAQPPTSTLPQTPKSNLQGSYLAGKQGALLDAQAEATRKNAETNQWTIIDAKQLGKAGFEVRVFGKGTGANGEVKTIQTLRINKVTGKTYDVLTGNEVSVIGDIPAHTAEPNNNTPDSASTPSVNVEQLSNLHL